MKLYKLLQDIESVKALWRFIRGKRSKPYVPKYMEKDEKGIWRWKK